MRRKKIGRTDAAMRRTSHWRVLVSPLPFAADYCLSVPHLSLVAHVGELSVRVRPVALRVSGTPPYDTSLLY